MRMYTFLTSLMAAAACWAWPCEAATEDQSVNVFLSDGVDQNWSERAPAARCRSVAGVMVAEDNRSIHQIQQEWFDQLPYQTEAQFDALWGTSARPAAKRSLAPRGPLQKKVVGWHPYWMGTAYQRYDYSSLSTIAYFSYEVNPTNGSYSSLRSWDTTPLIAWGASNGVKVVLTATLFGNSSCQLLLNNATSRQNLIDSLVTVVSNRNGGGVNIDFEGISDSTLKANVTLFLSNLTARFHRDIPGSEVSVALPAVDWNNVFDMAALDSFLDYAIIMGYDYSWKGGPTAGPVAPLQASSTFGSLSVSNSITTYLGKGIRPSKLLLGCPYYGYDWPTVDYSLPGATRGTGSAVLYPNAKANATSYGRQWSDAGGVPYYFYTNSGARQCFYDDAQSLGLKYDLINSKGIGGVGIWALGYDDPNPELWTLLAQKFAGEPVSTAWPLEDSGTTASFYGVGSRTGLVVAVGASGMIRTSSGGQAWQARTSGVGELLMNVDGTGPQFVAVGDAGRILTSSDGITWAVRTSSTTQMLRGITWGNGAYVAVGQAGVIVRSTDGSTWTLQASGTSNVLQGVEYGGGQFVAVGASGLILTSPDGLAWTSRVSGTSSWLYDVTHANGTYVAVGANGVILRSTNGINWAASASGSVLPIYRVAFGNGRFVAVGDSGLILSSSALASWDSEGTATTNVLRGVTFAEGQFTACGFNGTLLRNGSGQPALAIDTEPATVPNATTSYSVSGTANAFAAGQLRWTNSLGGSGALSASSSWSFSAPLAVGDNLISVTASNAAGQTVSASVTIARAAPAAAPGTPVAATQPAGALSDIVVYCSAGHGFTGDGSWITGRGLTYGMVEDMGNIDQLNFFADYCFQAGATVVPFRPVGFQTNEVVLDNASAGVTFGGAWNDSTSAIYYGAAGAVPYRYSYINTTGTTAWAIYRPAIPAAGFYPVYVWTRSGSDRVKQLYRVYHSGGVTDVRVNHRRVGLGWVWLGTYYFNAGTEGSVNISNYAPGENPASNVVIADAIRFGNGMGDIDRGVGVSGFERELEASRYWIQNMVGQGMSDSLYDLSGYNDNSDNVGAPPRMAAEMNRQEDGGIWDRIYLGFHSNADGGAGTARGAMGLYDNRGTTLKQDRQKDYGLVVAREINQDMAALDAGVLLPETWVNNSADMYGSAYGELYGTLNDEMNSTIIEVAFHNNEEDAKFLKNPVARRLIAMGSYQGIVKHLATNNPVVPLALLPEPPTSVRAVNSGAGRLTLSWTAPVSGGAFGDAATGYVVYRSTNGYGFGNPVAISGGAATSLTLTNLTAGETWYFHVAATNRGGESLHSKVVGARVSPSGSASHLVVDGFDRNERSQTPNRYFGNNVNGQTAMVRPRQINSFDYVGQHGQALAAAGVYFDSCENDSLIAGQVSLLNYHAAYWILGEESTANETFSSAEQTLVTAFLNAGRNLFVSGSEIAYDLGSMGTAADKAFLTNQLRAAYAADNSGIYQAIGKSGSIFAGLGSFAFDNGTGPTYNVNSADVLATAGTPSSIAALVYGAAESGTAIAGLQFSNTWRAVTLGFPFETILSESSRNALMARVVNFFGAAAQDAPVVRITTTNLNLPAGTTTAAVQGTNNAAVTGNLAWSNQLNGANGVLAAISPWTVSVPVLTGTNRITVVGRNAQNQASTASVQVVVATDTSSTNTPPSGIYQNGFETGNLDAWSMDTAGAWSASSVDAISGTFSLKHTATGATTNYIACQPSYNVANGLASWRFVLKNGNFDPSTGNRFHVYLMANQSTLMGSGLNGYAVGVNLTGSDDLLKLWRIANGSVASTVVASSLNWNANMAVSVEVTRTPGGVWSLSYATNSSFSSLISAGIGTDATYTNSAYFGLYFLCTSSYAGMLWLDDISITQEAYPEVTVLTPSTSVPNATTQIAITGRCVSAVGNLSWTNSAGGSGLLAAASNWSLTVSGLKTGDNVIQVIATAASGVRATGTVTITRSPYAAANAFHNPAVTVPGGGAMRAPAEPAPSKAVVLYSASQSNGTGNAATQTGGRLRYRRAGTAAWLSVNMEFVPTTGGSNAYWCASIPGNTFQSLNIVEYYFELTYSDRETTYVALDASGLPSSAGISQSIAQSRPFVFAYIEETPSILSDDFEVGGLSGWFFNVPHSWTNSTVNPITGSRSLKHNVTNAATTNSIYALPSYSLDSARTVWRFTLANGNFAPTADNRFHVFLMADGTNLLGAVNGYAVGVNLTGTDKKLKLWRVNAGVAVTNLITTPLVWGSNMTVAVEVVRQPSGQWEFRYNTTNRFSNMTVAASATDATHLRTDVFGLVYRCTSSRAGLLRMDDVRISQEVFSSLAVSENPVRVANGVTQCAISGTAAHVVGNLVWTNSLGGSGSGAVSTPNWTLNITGLKVGENRILLAASNAVGGRVTAETVIIQSAWSLGNAFHVPSVQIAGVDTMLSPPVPAASQPVYLYSASQNSGTGNVANQIGGRLFHRAQGTTPWSSVNLVFDSSVGTNAIWRGTIPAGTYAAGQTVEYSFELTYSDRETTVLQPFSFTYSASAAIAFFHDDFESGNLNQWTLDAAGTWENSASNPIAGARSLRHNLRSVASTNAIVAPVPCNAAADRTLWRFVLRNGNFDPSGNNKFVVYLMADRADLLGAVNGYAVGVNLTGTDDKLKIWRVANGSVAGPVATSDLLWDPNMTIAIEVIRQANGQWELRYGADGTFNALSVAATGTDAIVTSGTHFGLVFQCTSSYAGLLRMDDVAISRNVTPSVKAAAEFGEGSAGEGNPTILGLSAASDDSAIRWLVWPSTAGKVYAIEQSSNLLGAFTILQSGIPATPPENTFLVPVTADSLYLRIREQ